MEKYINKDVLVAEIKRRMDENREKQVLPQYFGMVEEDLNILSFIDTLEVKEVQEEPVSKQKLSNVERTAKNWKEDLDKREFHSATISEGKHVVFMFKEYERK